MFATAINHNILVASALPERLTHVGSELSVAELLKQRGTVVLDCSKLPIRREGIAQLSDFADRLNFMPNFTVGDGLLLSFQMARFYAGYRYLLDATLGHQIIELVTPTIRWAYNALGYRGDAQIRSAQFNRMIHRDFIDEHEHKDEGTTLSCVFSLRRKNCPDGEGEYFARSPLDERLDFKIRPGSLAITLGHLNHGVTTIESEGGFREVLVVQVR